MAFIISITTRLRRTSFLPFPLLLHPIFRSPLPRPPLTLPFCFFSVTPKAQLPEHLLSPLEHSPNHSFYESNDFEADDTQSCSNSSVGAKTYTPKDPLDPLDSSPSDYFYETSDFEVDETQLCSDSELHGLLQIMSQTKQFSSDDDAIDFLLDSGVQPSSSLVYAAMWELRREWKLAFWAFRWGEKCNCSNLEAWNLMVWILGKQRKFDLAWRLVRDMHRSAMATREVLLIMMRRYAAANDACKAIKTFQAMDKFKITADKTSFYTLLHYLCRHKNIEEAEELMFLNKKLFPLETESFNIILNGWCNIIVDVVEAKRVWREMSNCCITPDRTSYTHIISCLSKVGNLFDSLRLYDEMKKRAWVPELVVYNSLIYVLTKENCLKEALNLLNKITEMGLKPDSATYNSIIYPLCEAQKLEEARMVYNDMMEMGLNPTVGTYHALAKVENMVGTLILINRMREVGCGPDSFTFLLALSKFFRWGLPAKALKIWTEMKKYKVDPDSAHYVALVQGLASCGLLKKAREFFNEMKCRGFPNDPKLEKLLKELESNNNGREEKESQKKGDVHVMGRYVYSSKMKNRKPIKKVHNQSGNETEKDKERQEREIGRIIKHLRK